MYFIVISQCGNQTTTDNTGGTNCRRYYPTNMHCFNRKCCFKWFTDRIMDINKNSGCTYYFRNANKYNYHGSCSRYIHIYCEKCNWLFFFSIW